jgi:hypothetical protein
MPASKKGQIAGVKKIIRNINCLVLFVRCINQYPITGFVKLIFL